MKLIRNREHTINMGSYESLKVGASVEIVLPDDLFAGEKNRQSVYDKADVFLSEALKADLDEAIALLPPGSQSYVLSWRVNA